jgi:hypothetical protein
VQSKTIEQALVWTYRQELPKLSAFDGEPGGLASAWGAMSRFSELMAKVDFSPVNQFGVVVDVSAQSGPHPDAIDIAHAVAALDELDLVLPEDWDPLTDLGDLGPLRAEAVGRGLALLYQADKDGRLRLKTPPSRLIAKHALLGGAPDWRGEPPVIKAVMGQRGRPRWFRKITIEIPAGGFHEIEADGWNERRHRPYPNAYRKSFLDPDPAPVVVARGEYEVWRASLDVLVEDLSGALSSITLRASDAPAQPWLGDGRVAPRILRALTRARPAANPQDLRGPLKKRLRAS